MLVAVLQNQATTDPILVPADEAKRSDSFLCPECSEEVVFKSGNFKIAHFAHRAGSHCSYGTGEGADHMLIKSTLYQALKTSGWTTKMEHKIGECRTDIMAQKDDRKFCIEVQVSPIDIDDVVGRTITHFKNGFTTLWVLFCPYVAGTPDREQVNIRKWWLSLQRIQWGCLWFCDENIKVRPLHFGPGFTDSGAYSKRQRTVYWGPENLKLLNCDVGLGADSYWNVPKIPRSSVFWKR